MELIDKIRSRADKGEIFHTDSTSRSVNYKGWKIHGSESNRESGYGIRVIVNGRIGTAATTDSTQTALSKMIDDAVSAARLGEQIDIDFPATSEFTQIELYDENTENADIPELTEIGRELMSRLEKYRDCCDMGIDVYASSSFTKVANTEGFYGEYRKTYFSISASLVRVKEGDIYMAWEYFTSTHKPTDVNEAINPIMEKIDSIMEYAECIVPSPRSDRIPVIFTPDASIVLLLPLSQGIVGTNIYTKTSPIFNKLGEKLFDEKLSIYDDGTIKHKPASSPFDAEGIAKRKIPIIENGVLKNFIFDISTARKSGYESNGCATRSIFSPPQPSSSNVIIAPGDVSLDDMIADVREGIMVEYVLGLGQGNVISGAFSNPISAAFKIENGEIIGRVKNMAIAGNIYQNLKDITAISTDRKWSRGRYLAPYIRLDNISVVGK